MAEADGDPQSEALALWCRSYFYLDLKEIDKLKKAVERGLEHCKKAGIVNERPWWLTILRGWAVAELGEREEGIRLIGEGLENLRAVSSEVMLPHFLALLADQLRKVRKTKEALAVVDEAVKVTQKNGEHFWDAELCRLRGEFLAHLGPQGAEQADAVGTGGTGTESPALQNPESCFREALAIARRQEAKSLELRAAMSLARLLQKQGKRDEARRTLAEVYNWFTEGFDTTDLRKAKALLEELA